MELSCLIIRSQVPESPGAKYPTVICSGAGKEFHRIRDAIVYPHFSEVRLKRLSKLPDGRHAAQVKGAPRKHLAAGAILIAAGQAVYRSRVGYGISVRKIAPGRYTATGGLFREHRLPGALEVSEAAGGYRVRSDFDLPLVVGGRYRLTPENAEKQHAMPIELLLCIPQELDRNARRDIGPALSEIKKEVSSLRVYSVLLGLLGWAELPERLSAKRVGEALKSVPETRFAGDILELSAQAGRRFLIASELLSELTAKLQREVRHGGEETAGKLSAALGYPRGLIEAVTARLEQAGELTRAEGVFYAAGKAAGLSPMERGLLTQLDREASAGSLGRAGTGADRQLLRRLVRLHIIVEIGDRYLPMESYEAFAERLLHGKKPGGSISVSEAKATLGLPREQTIRFLESLDERGVLRRDGDLHRVVHGLVTG